MISADHDPYFDPGTGILRNKVHAVTWDELKAEEADYPHGTTTRFS
ncbi:hypothetical protein IEU95_01775 [Hoyosella rhizosphaerae]|nr:hypothetical protein [Hoyosella rhizosphaerae]MBN4925544.1 hypothetical protein [Hoyosella rhizosphaerae]